MPVLSASALINALPSINSHRSPAIPGARQAQRSQVPQCGAAVAWYSVQATALEQRTGRSAWTCLSDPVCFMPPAGRIRRREVQ
jgi:hypothetical protein